MTEPTTFREAYEVLHRHAQDLRNSDEPNIDNLLSVVSESVAAYKVCRQRIDAVEAALKEALANVPPAAPQTSSSIPARSSEAASPAGPRASVRPTPPPSFDGGDGGDDDVPF